MKSNFVPLRHEDTNIFFVWALRLSALVPFWLMVIIQFSFFALHANAQSTEKKSKSIFFIEPNLMLGKLVKNYSGFPKSNYRQTLFMDFGFYDNRKFNPASKYYNDPSSGISFAYSILGNDSVFGREIDFVPFIDFNASKQLKNSVHFKFGIGASYFTKHYNKISNPINEPIGSAFTWAFEAFIYKNFITRSHWNFKIGGGYLHASNGHTQLPNFGINSMMVSISARYFPIPLNLDESKSIGGIEVDRTKHFFLQSRFGLGYHEFGGTTGPTDGPKKLVKTGVVSGGIIFKQHVCIRVGFNYRFYDHYYDYILNNPTEVLTQDSSKLFITHPRWNASAVTFIAGIEFLYNHIGMDIESGINISKPFYARFNDLYENDAQPFYFLKGFFATRMGLNYYLISTKKNPRNNVFIGAHINANFGQADFSEASIGYVFKLK